MPQEVPGAGTDILRQDLKSCKRLRQHVNLKLRVTSPRQPQPCSSTLQKARKNSSVRCWSCAQHARKQKPLTPATIWMPQQRTPVLSLGYLNMMGQFIQLHPPEMDRASAVSQEDARAGPVGVPPRWGQQHTHPAPFNPPCTPPSKLGNE